MPPAELGPSSLGLLTLRAEPGSLLRPDETAVGDQLTQELCPELPGPPVLPPAEEGHLASLSSLRICCWIPARFRPIHKKENMSPLMTKERDCPRRPCCL